MITTEDKIHSIQRTARIAGLLYLLVVPLGVLGIIIPSNLIVTGDAAATAKNLIASESLFRISIVSNLLASVVMIFLVVYLYRLFNSVNKNAARLMVIFVLVAVPISMVNEVSRLAILHILNGTDFQSNFNSEQLQTLSSFFIHLYGIGESIAFIFWGLWLVPLGYLVIKSAYLPKIIGFLLMIACLGYLIDSFASLFDYDINVGLFTGWFELLFLLWLLINGVNVEQLQKQSEK